MTQEQLENKVMELLLSAKHEYSSKLYAQYMHSKTTNRTFTGCGFYADLEYPRELKIDAIHGRIMGVSVHYKRVDNGMGFVLFIKDGGISQVEGFSYIGAWNKEDIILIDENTFSDAGLDVYIKE